MLKVFKAEYNCLHGLQQQWPEGVLQRANDAEGIFSGEAATVINGRNLMKDGRFAFRMFTYWGDCGR